MNAQYMGGCLTKVSQGIIALKKLLTLKQAAPARPTHAAPKTPTQGGGVSTSSNLTTNTRLVQPALPYYI